MYDELNQHPRSAHARGGASAGVGMSPNRTCTRVWPYQRIVACAPESSTASTMAQVQGRGQGLCLSGSGTRSSSSGLGLRRQ
jgi:hypothetical protein